jgi:hypothetical protein
MRARAALGAMMVNRDRGAASKDTGGGLDRSAGLSPDAAVGRDSSGNIAVDTSIGLRRDASAGRESSRNAASAVMNRDGGVVRGVDNIHNGYPSDDRDGDTRRAPGVRMHHEHTETGAHRLGVEQPRTRQSQRTISRTLPSAFPYLSRRRIHSELMATGTCGPLHVVKFTADDVRQRDDRAHVGATEWDMSTEEDGDFVAVENNQYVRDQGHAQSEDPLSAYRLHTKLSTDAASPASEICTERVYAWQLQRNNFSNSFVHSRRCVEKIVTINTGVVNVSVCPHAVELAAHVLDGFLGVPVTADACMDDLLLVCMFSCACT